jgi:hypothetical protein
MTTLALGGCITTKATNTTVPTVIPTPAVTYVNVTATPSPAPAKPGLTAADVTFLKNAIDQESVSIKMIGDALALVKSGRYDSARTLAESAEKNLKSQYNNLNLARERAASIKHRTVNDLDKYLVEFEANFITRGGKIIWAEDQNEAIAEVINIMRKCYKEMEKTYSIK